MDGGKTQQIILNNFTQADEIFKYCNTKKIFLVCGKGITGSSVEDYFSELALRTGIEICRFSEYNSNPSYSSIVSAVECFSKEKCDFIVSAGGGSAIDVAKSVKLFYGMNCSKKYFEQEIISNNIPFMAVPTTAGTGSEATKFVVFYVDGVKRSVTHENCIPEFVMFFPEILNKLPLYYKRAAMMDALCQAIESYWSIHSNAVSISYSSQAIRLIMSNYEKYLLRKKENDKMLMASYYSGKAINITQTTAAHALSYKLTTNYGYAHGHAVAICLPVLWEYMIGHMELCVDIRGKAFVEDMFNKIAVDLGCNSSLQAVRKLKNMIRLMEFDIPQRVSDEEIRQMASSVNTLRLENNPIKLNHENIIELYHIILKQQNEGNI